MTITIDVEDYIKLLNLRREEINWSIPDIVWDYFIQCLRDGIFPTETAPSFVVDNIAINGDYGDLDNYVHKGESREEAVERLKDSALFVDTDKNYVIYSI